MKKKLRSLNKILNLLLQETPIVDVLSIDEFGFEFIMSLYQQGKSKPMHMRITWESVKDGGPDGVANFIVKRFKKWNDENGA